MDAEAYCHKCGQPDRLVRWGNLHLCLRCRPIRPCLTCGRVPPEAEFATPKAHRCVACGRERARLMQRSWQRGQPKRKNRVPQPHRPYQPNYALRHAAWVRAMPCLVGRTECRGLKVHAHHVRSGGIAGVGQKPGPERCVPLCIRHHMEGHTRGWQSFEARYGLDLCAIADALATASPHLPKPIDTASGPAYAAQREDQL